jgi:Domain of unknown function (DUF1844)
MNQKPDEKKKGENVDFVNLVLLIGTTANVELGFAGKDGFTKPQDVPRARQLINMLSDLQAKTQGRLNPQESQVLGQVLKDLQEKYVKAAGLDKATGLGAALVAAQYRQNMKK